VIPCRAIGDGAVIEARIPNVQSASSASDPQGFQPYRVLLGSLSSRLRRTLVWDFDIRKLRSVPTFGRSTRRLVFESAMRLRGLVDAHWIAGYHDRQRDSILPFDRKTFVMQKEEWRRKVGPSLDETRGRRNY